MPTALDIASKNAAIDAMSALLDGGKLQVWSGDVDDDPAVVPGGVLLAEITLAWPAFVAAVDGQAILAGLPRKGPGLATGQASFGRFVAVGGEGRRLVSIGEPGQGPGGTEPDVVVNTSQVTEGVDFVIDAYTTIFG